jgi:hypothetical protein
MAQQIDILWRYSGCWLENTSHPWSQGPSSGVIATPTKWASLCHSLQLEQGMPAIDFTTQLVLVVGGPGPNYIHLEDLVLDDAGDLRFSWGITEMAGPGFVYQFLLIARQGIGSVNGQPLNVEWSGS